MTAALATLNPAALVTLADCELRIERGLKSFIDVGEALSTIRDSRLYRRTHATFEDYCRERWGFSDRRASQFIEAASVVPKILGTGLPAPAVESQARALAAVPENERADVWAKAVERTGGKPTAKAVREVADERAAPPVHEAPQPAPVPTAEQRAQLSAAIIEALQTVRSGLTVDELWAKSTAHSTWVEPALHELVDAGRVEPAGRALRGNRMEPLWVLAEPVGAKTPEPAAATPSPVAGSGSPSPEPEPDGRGCEKCGHALDQYSADVGYLRCGDCDSEGDHVARDLPEGGIGPCRACHPEPEPALREPADPRPASPAASELADRLARDSTRRAAIRNLTSVLTYLNPISIAPAQLAEQEYAPVLDAFEQVDLDRAAETMTAIAAMKRGM